MQQRTFYEFFAGGGMARAGLGQGWRCLFANDFDAKKAASYRANWGGAEMRFADIHDLQADDLPGEADLAWASFPCQDLSLAGAGAGLAGGRSGAFWGLYKLVDELRHQGRAPRVLVLENVTGALTSSGGRDFEELCRALRLLGYIYGALTMDAMHFVPQSRPRLFIVAVRADVDGLVARTQPSPAWASAALVRAQAALKPYLKEGWRWWDVPAPPFRASTLADVLEAGPADVKLHTREETARLVAMMSEPNREKLRLAQAAGRPVAGTIYRRTRPDETGRKVQRAEVRFDGVAGCLRTPGGGSSRQTVIVVDGPAVRTRLLSPREAARLMGLPEGYALPVNYNDAYHLLGDGVAVPVVRFLAAGLLEAMLDCARAYQVAAE